MVDDGESDYLGERNAWLDLAPGEVPRRVKDGFVYGGRAFIRRFKTAFRAAGKFADKNAREMLQLDAARDREERNASSIPVELHAEVVKLAASMDQRTIAKVLEKTWKVKTSHASVGRVVRKARLAAARASRSEAVQDEVEMLRIQLSETFEALMDAQAELLEQQQAPGAAELKHVPVAIRIHQQTAALLERRLRAASRDLPSLAQPAETISPLNASERGPGAVLPIETISEPAPSEPPVAVAAILPLNASERGPGANPREETVVPPSSEPPVAIAAILPLNASERGPGADPRAAAFRGSGTTQDARSTAAAAL